MFRCTLLVLLVFACAAGTIGAGGAGEAGAHPSDSLLDQDHDGVNDPPHSDADNCAGEDAAFNPAQTDTDADGKGDACDTDDDGDSVDDALDNCPLMSNQAQADVDGDNVGDACDIDDDGDGFADSRDNCRFTPNPGQQDADGDGIGDACEDAPPASAPEPAGRPAVADAAAPDVGLRVRKRHRTSQLGAGLAVPVSCSERCTLSSRLRLSARDARRLDVGRLLGTGVAELDAAGSTYVFIDLARPALARVPASRRVRALLRVVAADAAGNRRTMTRRLTIRR